MVGGLYAALAALTMPGCGGAPRPPAEEPAAAIAALVDAAHAREKARDYLAARALYERAVASAGDRASRSFALDELGSALVFFGEYEDAERVLGQLAALAPDRPRVWHDLAMLAAHRGDPATAEVRFRKAIALAPRDPRPRIALAALLLRQHDTTRALVEYQALARLDLAPRLARAVARAIALLTHPGPPAPPPPGDGHGRGSPLY